MSGDDRGRRQLTDKLEKLLDERPEEVELRSRRLLEQLLSRPDRPVVLYGAGNLGRRTQALLAARGLEVAAFIDNDRTRWGTKSGGAPVMSPGDASQRFAADGTVIDTIWRAEGGHDHLEVRRQLADLGWVRVESFIHLYWGLGEGAVPWLAIDRPIGVIESRDAILDAAHLWADLQSLREYVDQVCWRLTGDFGALSRPEPDQYFARGLVKPLDDEVFADCGAYVGDTLQDIARRVSSWRAYHAFEPDPESFGRLQEVADRLPPHLASRTRLHRAATAETARTARFAASGLASAALGLAGEIEVECVAIDAVMADEPPTFIKMDIEGAEGDAITGAAESIRVNRPLLAISAYHRQSDLWVLAQRVAELNPDSRLHLRPHNAEGFDTILYAIPPDRQSP